MTGGILVLDFGSQYTQLILKRLRAAGYYCEIDGPTAPAAAYAGRAGIILSGGPASAGAAGAPTLPGPVLEAGVPVLGICYGMQLLAYEGGGALSQGKAREYGPARCHRVGRDPLFTGLPKEFSVWMSHGDAVEEVAPGWHAIAATGGGVCAAMRHEREPRYGLQFHPEVVHTPEGATILANFASRVCGLEPSWSPARMLDEALEHVRERCGSSARVLVGLSGGVDSSVTAALCLRALGPERVFPVLVDTGFLRKDEAAEVSAALGETLGMKVRVVDASEQFFAALRGVAEPESKRKTIGRLFIEVFEREARRLDGLTHLAQGTLYPDLIESMPWRGPSATIKSHHNVGGLPERLHLALVEPLRMLFKDDVRAVGKAMGLPAALLGRHPFPGPGLAIRILGEPTRERAELLRRADAIFLETLRRHGFYDRTWQAFAVLLPIKSVGVMGDSRTYEQVCALRAVDSVDGMTADWTRIPYEILGEASARIVNEVRGINRVVFDITSKPPGTIEWE